MRVVVVPWRLVMATAIGFWGDLTFFMVLVYNF